MTRERHVDAMDGRDPLDAPGSWIDEARARHDNSRGYCPTCPPEAQPDAWKSCDAARALDALTEIRALPFNAWDFEQAVRGVLDRMGAET